ncbi:MAG: sulfotransferase [Bacteroidota bacterium]|nr:sulfotransferase [Bacteroidota bacterium]
MDGNLDLPNLLIVGAAKSGTTSLHNYLKQHPDIFMTEHKEPHFLINFEIGESRVHKAVITLKKYKKMFKTEVEYRYKGESSVMYLAFPEFSIKNIKKYLTPDVKIIIMLRNPIERAFAGYLHNLRYNPSENLSFEEAIKNSEDRYHKDIDITPDTRYLYVGEYYSQVKEFMDEFKENVHVILYDDYVSNINLCFNKVFDFLEIEKIAIDTSMRHMEGGWMFRNKFLRNILIPQNNFKSLIKSILPNKKIREGLKQKMMNMSTVETPHLSSEMRNKLKMYYKQDVANLAILLNRDLNHWIDKS